MGPPMYLPLKEGASLRQPAVLAGTDGGLSPSPRAFWRFVVKWLALADTSQPTPLLWLPIMRILVVMLLPIGDTLFATPALHALRKHYPQASITVLAYPTNAGILRSNPDVDDFVLWPTRQTWPGIRGVIAMFRKLREARFSMAVEFGGNTGWISALSRNPRRTEMYLPRLWWLLPWAGKEWRQKHAVEHYADVVRRLGIPVEDLRLRMYVTEAEKARARQWLHDHGVLPGKPLVGIHPGGEGLWGRKRWSVEGFAKVADGLADRLGARILLMGGKADIRLAEQLASLTHADYINAVGRTTLGETAALMAHCALFIGNDSSPLHIAAAMGARVVGIYGPTDPRSYHPWVPGGKEGMDYAVVRSPLPCACRFSLVGGQPLYIWVGCLLCPALKVITPQQVLEAAIRLLSVEPAARHSGPPDSL